MLYKELNDYELVYLVSEGNEDAYDLIYKKYYPLIRKMASRYYSILGYVGLEKEDLIQSGLCGLLRAANCYSENIAAKFYTCALVYAQREMQRTIKDYTRLKHSFINNSVSFQQTVYSDDEATYDEVIGEGDIENLYIDYVSQKKILDFKYEFKPLHAQIYELRLAGFSCGDIAKLLDIKYKTVDNSLGFIKNKLKNLLLN